MLILETLFHFFLQPSATVKQLTGSSDLGILLVATDFMNEGRVISLKLSVIKME